MMETNRLFGTDGIRSKFQEWPLTIPVIYHVSLAFGQWLKKKFKNKKSIRVIIGKDTRSSCDEIEQYLTYGLMKNKIKVSSAGVIPTPGLAFLTHNLDVELGIMISASHNLASDNGIKFFKHNGFKLTERQERQIERITFSLLKKRSKPIKKKNLRLQKISTKPYLDHLKECVPHLNLKGKKIVVDCAHGAVSGYVEKLFGDLGAKVLCLYNRPNGRNINFNCGALHPQNMAEFTRKKQADIGFSFDGDGDRVILSDEKGKIFDGDHIMALVARHFLKNKQLSSKTVVATSMSNFGLEKFMSEIRVKLIRSDVGDKFVLKDIIKNKANFGGEQSGHIIFLDYSTTGDGVLTSLQVLRIMQEQGRKINKLVSGFKKYPQVLYNVRVKKKKDFRKMPFVWKKAEHAQKKLKGNGRLVLRYSGTEPLARVMVEGKNKKIITSIANSIVLAIKNEIGC